MSIEMLHQNAETLDEVIKKYSVLKQKRQMLYDEILKTKNNNRKKELKEISSSLDKLKNYILALLTSMQKQIDSETKK
ncbi:hypothetical protein HOA59_03125 [archaeon]|nr:hypothetical protein [archaeon]MBT6824401.1 hypothetical protein [archaeon]MBT7297377.1 hypothetical protein [archaeon]